MNPEQAQRRVFDALLEHHPILVSHDELRGELADVHDIDQALTALLSDGLAMRFGDRIGPTWIAVRADQLRRR